MLYEWVNVDGRVEFPEEPPKHLPQKLLLVNAFVRITF